MQHALENYANTLLIDSDMILTAPLGFVDDTKDISLSPMANYFRKCEKYCGGWIFASNKAFLNWLSHRVTSINNRFADQIALEEADSIFSFFLFPKTVNFITEHHPFLIPGSRKNIHRALHFQSDSKHTLTYRNQTIVSIHMHYLLYFGPRQPYYWTLFHLQKQFPVLLNEINRKYNRAIDHLVSQQDSLFFLFKFCFF